MRLVLACVFVWLLFATGFSIFGEYVNDSSMVGWWHFNEGSGTAVSDSSGNGNNGTIYGASWTSSGKFGNALSFDGVNDYVDVDNPSLYTGMSQLTLEAWVYSAASQSDKGILGWNTAADAWMMWLYPTNTLSFFTLTTGSTSLQGALTLTNTQWTHIAMVYDGTNMLIYKNGVLDSNTAAQSGNITGGGGTRAQIGAYSTKFFNGTIDEVAIYNRSLSAAEIYNHANLCIGNASGNWYINNQNVSCRHKASLGLGGSTVYLYGASNVSFLNITNSSIVVAAYDTANVTLDNVTIGSLYGYGNSTFVVKNLSFISTLLELRINSSIEMINSSANTANHIYLSGGPVTITNSTINTPSGNYYTIYLNASNSIFINSTFSSGWSDIYFKNNATITATNSTFYAYEWGYFQDSIQAQFANCTFTGGTWNAVYGWHVVALTGSQAINVTNLLNEQPMNGYFNTSTMRVNFTDTITRHSGGLNHSLVLIMTGNSSAAIQNSSIQPYIRDNSTVIFDKWMWTNQIGETAGIEMGGASINITNSGITNPTGTYQYYYFNATTIYINNLSMSGGWSSLYFRNRTNVRIYNSSITQYYSPTFQDTAVVNATNTTFKGTAQPYLSFSGTATLWNNSYAIIGVKDSTGKLLSYADVVSANNASVTEVNTTTESNGYVQLALLQGKMNATENVSYQQTINATAVGGEASNFSLQTMTTTKYVNITLIGTFNYATGSASFSNFPLTLTVNNSMNGSKPYNGSRQVELRQGTTLVANFSWNFSVGDLNMSNVTVTRSTDERYVGINGTNVTPFVTTVWVPVWGKTCNVKVCSGKANFSHCSSSDWVAASSVQVGDYCLVAVNGTVVQDRPTAITTKMVIKVPGWDEPLVAALFAAALVVFVWRRR